MNAINRAKRGDLVFFKEVPLDILLNARDSNDDTVLSVVVYDNRLDCSEVICKRCPSLLYYQDRRGTPLHTAAYYGYLGILKLIISTCDKADQEGDRAGKQKTLTLKTTRTGNNAMHMAIYGRQLESVKFLIEADQTKELLRAGNPNNNTPLHLAVGKTYPEIARLLIKADSDFPYGVNSDRKTPLLIAIDKAELGNDRVMLKLIMELQPTQSMVSVNENGWTTLHYCVSRKFVDTIGYIIQSCPESSKVPDNEGQNFFHHVVKSGNVKMVIQILGMKEITSTVLNNPDNSGRTPLDVAAESKNTSMLLCLPNENGDTILSKAARENHLFWCKELYKRCPPLIYHQSKDGRTALHNAAWTGEPEMLKFLIEAGAKPYNEYAEDDIESGGGEKIPQEMLLTMLDDKGDTALHRAVLNHKLEAVKLLVEADPGYEYGANTSGETPIMISVREAQSNENMIDSGKIRKLLLFKMQPSQTVARIWENDCTLLHQATLNGDISIIENIIKFYPICLDLVDKEGKNFLHIAARRGKAEVVRQVLRSKNVPFNVLNGKDNDGNTPLHIAAMNGNDALTKCFLYDSGVIKTTKNNAGQHVLKAINFDYDKRKAGVLGIIDTVDQSDLKDQRDFDLVVGALIATVSFTAGITVPGGYNSEGPSKGTAVFSKNVSFAAFIISNTFALIFSLYAVFSHFCARRLREDAGIIYLLKVAKGCTLAAMYCMMVAFIAGSFTVLANSNWLAIVVCIISCLFFIFACGPLWMIAMERKRLASASQQKRST